METGKPNAIVSIRSAKVAPSKVYTNNTSNESDDQENILSNVKNNDHKRNIPWYFGLLGLLGLIVGVILSSLVVLIPQSNVIEQSNEWYKFSLLYSVLSGLGVSINFGLVQPSYWMEINFFRSWKPFLIGPSHYR